MLALPTYFIYALDLKNYYLNYRHEIYDLTNSIVYTVAWKDMRH